MKKIKHVVSKDAWRYRLSASQEHALANTIGSLVGLTPRMAEQRLNDSAIFLPHGERKRLFDIVDAAAEKAGCYGDEPWVNVRSRGHLQHVSAYTGNELHCDTRYEEEA